MKVKVTVNPNMKKFDETQSKVVQEKINKANEMLKNVGLPKEAFIKN